MKIALDAGHGRNKQGRRSDPDFGRPEVFEYVVARQVARLVAARLSGHDIIETFEQQDLPDEKRVRKALGCDLLCSFHTGDEPGLAIGVAGHSQKSRAIALAVCASLQQSFPLPCVVTTDSSVIATRGANSKIPTLVWYLGSLSDWRDVINLRSVPYKEALATAIADAILAHMAKEDING